MAYQVLGRNYIYAHARPDAFLRLWEVRVGDEIQWDHSTWVVYEYGPVLATEVDALNVPPRVLVLQTSTGPNSSYPEWIVRGMMRTYDWRLR